MKRKFLGFICLIYSGLVLFIIFKNYLNNFLSPNMHKYIILSLPFLIIMGLVLIHDKTNSKFKISDAVLLLPIIMLVFANNGRLTTALASNRTTNFNKQSEIKLEKNEESILTQDDNIVEYNIDEIDYDIVDEAYAALTDIITYNKDASKFVGKTVRIKGFTLMNTPGIPKGYFAIGKYVISCCAADASFGGFISKYDGDVEIKENEWYEIEGVLNTAKDVNGYDIIIINVVNIKQIDGSKEEIYVYPCYSYDNGECGVLKNYDLNF